MRPFAITYRAIFDNIVSALFYFFFAVFPARSPIDRRLPWLKWFGLLFMAGVASLQVPVEFGKSALYPAWLLSRRAHLVIASVSYGLVFLGFASLVWNDVVVTSSEARRKIRVIMWGTLVGVVPATLALAAGDFLSFRISTLLGATVVVLLWLFPLLFAYAVVKHRVLEYRFCCAGAPAIFWCNAASCFC